MYRPKYQADIKLNQIKFIYFHLNIYVVVFSTIKLKFR